MDQVVLANGQAMAQEAATRLIDACAQAVARSRRFVLALAGGATPAALYELLASPGYAERVAWSQTHVFFGDERCVGPDHAWSNYRLARQALLDRVPLSTENVHRISGEAPRDQAARAYAETIGQVLGSGEGAVPHFDLILLGMGDDGHTASLFPGMPALTEARAWVVGTAVPEYVRPQVDRVTLTVPVLNAAADVLFLVSGASKAAAVRRVMQELDGDADVATLPAAYVRPTLGRLTWLLDAPAAALLRGA